MCWGICVRVHHQQYDTKQTSADGRGRYTGEREVVIVTRACLPGKKQGSPGGCRPTDGHAVRHARIVRQERKECWIHVQAASTLASVCDTYEPRSPIDQPGPTRARAGVHHMHRPSRYAPIQRAYAHKHVISMGTRGHILVGRTLICITHARHAVCAHAASTRPTAAHGTHAYHVRDDSTYHHRLRVSRHGRHAGARCPTAPTCSQAREQNRRGSCCSA